MVELQLADKPHLAKARLPLRERAGGVGFDGKAADISRLRLWPGFAWPHVNVANHFVSSLKLDP
jgi:hypothetical protein